MPLSIDEPTFGGPVGCAGTKEAAEAALARELLESMRWGDRRYRLGEDFVAPLGESKFVRERSGMLEEMPIRECLAALPKSSSLVGLPGFAAEALDETVEDPEEVLRWPVGAALEI